MADKALKRGLDKYGKEQKANAFLDWVQRDVSPYLFTLSRIHRGKIGWF